MEITSGDLKLCYDVATFSTKLQQAKHDVDHLELWQSKDDCASNPSSSNSSALPMPEILPLVSLPTVEAVVSNHILKLHQMDDHSHEMTDV